MMNIIIKMTCLGLLVFSGLAFSPPRAQSAMIEPSRTLGDAAEPQSKLTVLSEPAGFDIVLDGQLMGKTPMFLIDLQPGTHSLKVKNMETTIRVEAGKTLQISLYKGNFLIIPAAAKQPQEKTTPDEKKSAKPKPSPAPVYQRPEDGLTPMERYRLLRHY